MKKKVMSIIIEAIAIIAGICNSWFIQYYACNENTYIGLWAILFAGEFILTYAGVVHVLSCVFGLDQ